MPITAKEPAFFAVKYPNGNYISFDGTSGIKPVPTKDQGCCFYSLDADTPRLKTLMRDMPLRFTDSGPKLGTKAEEPTAVAKGYSLERIEPVMPCRCGDHAGHTHLKGISEIQYAVKGHEALVGAAFDVVKNLRIQAKLPPDGDDMKALALIDSLWNNGAADVERALKEADYLDKEEYTWFLFEPHFYDPVSGENYRGNTDRTARSMAETYSERAKEIIRGEAEAGSLSAAYNLGLALHYLTDLAQPMHAANYANSLLNWRHSGFEEAAETLVPKILKGMDLDLKNPEWKTYDPGARSRDEVLLNLAKESLAIFKGQKMQHALKASDWKGKWKDGYTKPILDETVSLGLRSTVAYLIAWGREAVGRA